MRRIPHSLPVIAGSCAWLGCLVLVGPAVAQDTQTSGPKAHTKAQTQPHEKEEQVPGISVTGHKVTVNGEVLEYTATAGCLQTKDESGKPAADLFFVAYVKEGPQRTKQRPVAFAFNGGPGGSSVWLHLGALGPRRVVIPNEGKTLPREFELVDNDCTWLDFTDLVFIDPVGTGYSRAAPGADAAKAQGVTGDIESTADFIRLYLSQYERWESPKLLVGESYGTTRAAGLSGYLQDKLGIYLDSIVMISTALDFRTISFDPGNDLPYLLYLPSYTAAAWYHKRLPKDLLELNLEGVTGQAERWAAGEYLLALTQGDALPKGQREKVAADMARYTGLTPQYILRNNLRVSNRQFMKELLRGEDKVVGLMDGRVTGFDVDPGIGIAEYDPSMSIAIAPFVACVNDYLRKTLAFKTDLSYRFLSETVNERWDWGKSGRSSLDVAPTLQAALTQNEHLRVFVASGYYDLNTAYFAKKYVFDHLGLNPNLRGNIVSAYYPAGHQMYTDLASLKRLKADVAAFVKPPR
jgi:carboxypeptidase C (cathepsin A)